MNLKLTWIEKEVLGVLIKYVSDESHIRGSGRFVGIVKWNSQIGTLKVIPITVNPIEFSGWLYVCKSAFSRRIILAFVNRKTRQRSSGGSEDASEKERSNGSHDENYD